MIHGIISVLIGIVIVFPFLITIVFLVTMRKLGKAPVSVLGQAADWTTPFLFLSVYITSSAIFGEGMGYYITGIAILVAILQAVFERMKEKEFKITRSVHKTWRLYFLILGLSYLILIVAGVILKVSEYVK
ncbi:DUF3397 domain-containing protein [Sporosarcina highlanderae]|uniref:DUF3397 domain-containing protein n=1 Tax=Sporosarcina highlanderae TaxID=3035916 RepID=A0ABT8JR44_9BACL|nr:DUF3397 domain-containing protein [Sporosarcina highlanderae]MDN4607560.1 DUF3397 domain-containing protein [Sporosarcina highlanderae]